MSIRTVSEEIFENLCSTRGIGCARIPESTKKTADYEVSLGQLILITEVKQLDLNEDDKKLAPVWGTEDSPGAVAPSDRVQGLIEEAYPQVKSSCEGKRPTMIVVYNNSGHWNWIDTFTVAKAMFGSFGIVLGLQRADEDIEDLTLLIRGKREPRPGMERHFVQVMKGLARPCSEKEAEWFDYWRSFAQRGPEVTGDDLKYKYQTALELVRERERTIKERRSMNYSAISMRR